MLFGWMFEHDCLDTCCLGDFAPCVLYFGICPCAAQLSLFPMERRSRNTIVIIIVIIIIIIIIKKKLFKILRKRRRGIVGGGGGGRVLSFVGCLTSQQHSSVSQGRICSDNFTCCHTEIEVADPTLHLTQSQYTDSRLTSPSTDPTTPGA